jgi:hypothetical protein
MVNNMTIQNYLMVENNVVTNICVWDGDINTWTPPSDTTMLIQATTPSMVWKLNSDKTDWILTEIIGDGAIGFTWDGSVLTTNQPKPTSIEQPATTGTVSA